MIRNVLKTLGSRRVALVAGVAVPMLMSLSAYAQQPAASPGTQIVENAPGPAAPPAPAAAGEATTERVVVTGSYIPTAEEVTASPLDTLTVQEINRSGTQDVLQVLQKRNPDFVGAGNLGQTNANVGSGSTLGGAVAQIRGFPTLILYEGRRITTNAAIAAGGAEFSDVSLFPAALLSRIEVLKDGASALYGSEAVGGVINIFTKDEYEGAEVGFRYGTTVEGAVAERRGYAIFGAGNETTHVTVGMQYYERDALFMRQREYSNEAIGGTTTYGGSVRDVDSRYIPIGFDPLNWPGNPIANSPFDTGAVPGTIGPGVGFDGPGLANYYTPASLTEITNYNLARIPTSTLDESRTNVVAAANHQIFGKQLELFGNFLYSNNDFRSFLNAQPLSNNTGVIIPAGRIGTQDDVNAPDYVAGVTNTIFNPFNYQIDASTGSGPNRTIVGNRFNPDFPRIFDNTNNFYRFLIGARSQINEDWFFETAATYSKYDISYVNSNLVLADQLNSMIAGTATDINGLPIPALDFFALNPIGTGPGQVSGDQFATIFGGDFRQLGTFQRSFDAKIVGFPFKLPAGKVGFSTGAEYRLEGLKVQASPQIFVGSVPIGLINRKRDITSAFAEVNIPLVSSSMNIPFVYNLDVGAAGRWDHYEAVSEDALVPKVTLRYQPIKDLTLRATYSQSFIAPNLYQLFGPPGSGFSTTISLADPLGGNPPERQDQAQVLVPSNPDLVPSKAETYTAGLVYSPSFIPGLTLTADYFRILQRGIVAGLGGATILGSVNNLGTASPYYGLVGFNNFPGQPGSVPVNDPSVNPDLAGNPNGVGLLFGNLAAVFYVDQLRNTAAQRTEGFDLSLRYNLDMHAAGQLEFGINAVVFTKYDLKTTVTSEYYNVLGLDFPELTGGNPDYKLTGLLEYRIAGFTLGFNANYIPEMLNAIGTNPEEDPQDDPEFFPIIEDFFSVDGRLSYTFKGRTTPGAMVESKDAKSMVDSKGGGAAVAGAETMSPVQKLLDGLTLTVGCNNMFDEQPPFIAGANSNTDLSLYDPFGRFVYFEISKKF